MTNIYKIGDSADSDLFLASSLTIEEVQVAVIRARQECGGHWTEEAALANLVDDSDDIKVVRSYTEKGFGEEPVDRDDEYEYEPRWSWDGSVWFIPKLGKNMENKEGPPNQLNIESIVDSANDEAKVVAELQKQIDDRKKMPKAELQIIAKTRAELKIPGLRPMLQIRTEPPVKTLGQKIKTMLFS